jgi:hypothetical protein
MLRVSIGCALLASLFVVSACAKKEPPPILQVAMSQTVAPQAQVLWDVSNKATNDNGDPDGSKMTAEQWTQLATAGETLRAMAQKLADADKLTAAAPGVKLQGEENPGSSNAAQVQGFLDKDMAAFKAHAAKLATTSGDFAAAAKAKDAVKLADVSGKLDAVCEACHMQFWYPQQAAQP